MNQISVTDLLPSPVRVDHRQCAAAVPPADPAGVWWRRPTARAHLIVITTCRWYGSAPTSAGGHPVEAAVSTTGPPRAHRETSHEPATPTSLIKHHGKATVFIRFIVEVRVIWLCSSFYGSLKMASNNCDLVFSRNDYYLETEKEVTVTTQVFNNCTKRPTSAMRSSIVLIHSTTLSVFPPTSTTRSVDWGQHSWNSLMLVFVVWKHNLQINIKTRHLCWSMWTTKINKRNRH